MEELEIAKRRAMHLLGARDYGEKELLDKLRKNYSEKTCLTVVSLMTEYGYIDDERYAKKLAKLYIETRKYGKSRASLMMRQKGLDPETIKDALDFYDSENLVSEIAELIRKKYTDRLFIEGLEGKKEVQKVVAALARRGYSYNDIKSALYIIEDEYEE